MASQVKSKSRVNKYGEVFTAEREVNAMMDLVADEANKIDSTFLEPACGNGNFLAEIFKRKLKTIENAAGINSADYEYLTTRAVSSIYGVDIQEDNVIESRERLYRVFLKAYHRIFNSKPSNICERSIRFILSQNIQCGNTLTGTTSNNDPLMITQWGFDDNDGLSIKIYNYSEMISSNGNCSPTYSLPRIPYYMLPAIVR